MSKKKKKREGASRKQESEKEPPPSEPSAAAAGTGRGMSALAARLTFLAIIVVCSAADIGSKYAVFGALDVKIQEHEGTRFALSKNSIPVAGETLSFRAALNTGAVFGILQGRRLMLVLFAVLALGIISWVIYKSQGMKLPMIVGLGFVCSGAIGNLWDRILFHGVRDFIQFTCFLLEPFFEGGQWPTFNLADAWICVGIPLIAIGDFLRTREIASQTAGSKAESL